jgi:hypothetical protein
MTEDLLDSACDALSVEGDMTFRDGSVHYLVQWSADPDPGASAWRPASFLACRPDLISRYWFEKYSRLRDWMGEWMRSRS